MNLFLKFTFVNFFAALCLVQGFVSSAPSSSSTTTAFLSKSKLSMSSSDEVIVGDKIPSIVLNEIPNGAGKPEDVNIADLIAGKKVAIFGVPGAFTPGCSKSHLPSFMDAKDDLKEKGVELTICIATNDAFVMEAWGRTSGGADAGIRFLADGKAELTKALGLVMETPNGIRTKRFSLIAENGVVTHYFSAAEQASDTWAPKVLSSL